MPNYRRAFVPGGTFFFTVVTQNRAPVFADFAACRLLGDCLRECQRDWPFEINAIVLLHDHLHALWTLPPGDSRYSARWSWIKKEFSVRYLAAGGVEQFVSAGKRRERRRGVWQRRFWEHAVSDADDFEIRFDYIHFNPVKHGYVQCPGEWSRSSFHRWVQRGVYPPHWACSGKHPSPDFRRIDALCGEPE